MNRRYDHIIAMVRNRPWALLPGVLMTIRDLVAMRASGITLSDEEVQERLAAVRDGQGERTGRQQANGVALIPVYGVLTPKAGLMSDMSGATSVDTFAGQFRTALADPDVASIVLDVDSPGGLTDMIPEMATEIRAARGQKPIVAVANTMMASAAYWLGSQADEIVASPSAMVGSIGVYAAHEDLSAAYEQAGVKTTLISAGKYKAEGNDLGPLSDDAKAHIQEIVDETYGMFVADVAKGRGATVNAVRKGYGEGRVLTAQAAKSAGLIDRIATLDETIGRMFRAPRKAVQAQYVSAWVPAESVDGLRTFEIAGEIDPIPMPSPPPEPAPVPTPEPEPLPIPDPQFAFERERYARRRSRVGS